MHDTKVVMKDGTLHIGPIYLFRPEEGFMTLVLNEKDYPEGQMPERLFFRDMASATTENQRVTVSRTSTEDELQRARESGWDGS